LQLIPHQPAPLLFDPGEVLERHALILALARHTRNPDDALAHVAHRRISVDIVCEHTFFGIDDVPLQPGAPFLSPVEQALDIAPDAHFEALGGCARHQYQGLLRPAPVITQNPF
jgi:hypothetical protein